MRKWEFASPLKKHRTIKRKREREIESSKMTKASGAGDSVALKCMLLLYCSGNTATSCVPLLFIPLLPPVAPNSTPGKMQVMFSPSPKDPRANWSTICALLTGEPKSPLSEHRWGVLAGCGWSSLNRPHLEGLYPPGMSLPQGCIDGIPSHNSPQIYYGPSLDLGMCN